MPGRRWTNEEIEFLQENVGSDEVQSVVTAFKKRWPDRTDESVLIKITRLNLSRIPIDGGWNCTGLGNLLGCDRDRVHDWIERGLLKTSRRKGKKRHRILEKHFAEFATNHPEWLRDIPADRLSILLPDPIVSVIEALPDRTRGVRFKVRSQRTGRVYGSLRSAEKSEYLSRRSIADIVKTGRTTRDGFGFSLLQRGQ